MPDHRVAYEFIVGHVPALDAYVVTCGTDFLARWITYKTWARYHTGRVSGSDDLRDLINGAALGLLAATMPGHDPPGAP